ncbi:MAG: tetratricopeptide repeat protein [Planctomycetes bacterium]|nr:tetratricopeptide repeat protein [Planctomycetota bacterium]
MTYLRKAVALEPDNVRAHYDLAMILLHSGKLEEAGVHVTAALARMPAEGLDRQYPAVRLHLDYGEALLLVYRLPEAKMHLLKVLELEPTNAQAHGWLARVVASLGDLEGALQYHTEAMKLDPGVDDSPWLHDVLAEHLCRKRRFHEAVRHEERALAMAQAAGDEGLAARLQKTLEYYRRLEQAAQR